MQDKRKEKKKPGKNGDGCRQGAGKATTGTGSSCSRDAGQRTASKKSNYTKCPCKTGNHQGQPWVSQEPVCLRAPENWVHPAGLTCDSKENVRIFAQEIQWLHHPIWYRTRLLAFYYKTQLSGCQLLWFSVRINCTSPKNSEDLWSYQKLHWVTELLAAPPHQKHRNLHRICPHLKAMCKTYLKTIKYCTLQFTGQPII